MEFYSFIGTSSLLYPTHRVPFAGKPPPQKKLHREAKRKIEDKPDERLKSARRALSAIFTSMPCPPTPEPPKRLVSLID